MADEKNNEEHYMHFLHTPKLYCRHIKASLTTPNDMNAFPDINSSCSCGINGCDEKDNWLCLKCYKIFCGRISNKHMMKHYENDTNKKHCIVMGVSNLSFWCYKCNDYLHHLTIHKILEIYKIAHIKKFGIEMPTKTKSKKSKNRAYFDSENDYDFDPEQVKKWRYGDRIRHSMECEGSIQGHPQGAVLFIKLLNEFKEEHKEQVKMNDIDVILEIIVSFDRVDLLKLVINHPYLSLFLKADNNDNNNNDNDDENDDEIILLQNKKQSKPLQSSLKKSIRSGNLNVLNYLMTQNVINIQLFNDKKIESKQYENDLKSLLFTILRGIEIGSKKQSTNYKSNCFNAAKLFWPYLCQKVCDYKMKILKIENENIENDKNDKNDKDALQKLITSNDTDNALEKITNLKSMNNDYLSIKYISLFMTSMIKQRMNNNQYIAIFDVLQFLRERYITFNTRNNIKNGWKPICNELIINYSDKINKNNNCLELEMIDYLISGGLDINIINNKIKNINDKYLNQTIKKGINNWNMKNWKLNKIKEIMPNIIPIEINQLIIHILCL